MVDLKDNTPTSQVAPTTKKNLYANKNGLETIYIGRSVLNAAIKCANKMLLHHFLASVEYMTRKTFFPKEAVRLHHATTPRIGMNSYNKIYASYKDLGVLNIEKRQWKGVFASFPSNHPKRIDDWPKLKGGYAKIDRAEIISCIEALDYNELRVYFLLLSQRELSLHYDKVPEANHCAIRHDLNIKKDASTKAIKGLKAKKFLTTLSANDNFCSEFHYSLTHDTVTKNLIDEITTRPTVTKNPLDTHPKPARPLTKNRPVIFIENRKEKIKEQTSTALAIPNEVRQVKPKRPEVSGFNFFKLNKLERPLTLSTVLTMSEKSGLDLDSVQVSVENFAKYYFAHETISKYFTNPVGYLRNHLIEHKTIYIPPEDYNEIAGHTHLGPERFEQLAEGKDKSQQQKEATGDFKLSDLLAEFAQPKEVDKNKRLLRDKQKARPSFNLNNYEPIKEVGVKVRRRDVKSAFTQMLDDMNSGSVVCEDDAPEGRKTAPRFFLPVNVDKEPTQEIESDDTDVFEGQKVSPESTQGETKNATKCTKQTKKKKLKQSALPDRNLCNRKRKKMSVWGTVGKSTIKLGRW